MAGSIPLTRTWAPATRAPSSRTLETTASGRSAARARPAAGETGSQPLDDVTTCPAATSSTTSARALSPRPVPRTVTNVTSARPIIRAAAVAAVRAGLRTAFSRASAPAAPVRPRGQPTTAAIGRTSRDDTTATPMNRASTPAPIIIIRSPVARPSASRPRARAAPASAVATTATTAERRDGAPSAVAPSRTAAIGGTRVARMAGTRPASSVTSVPTSSATTTVRVAKTVSPCGMSRPITRNSSVRPDDSSTPSPRPTSEATTPMIPASARTERSTWRRVAPSVRRVASSRERWATVMLRVLKMTKAPTKRAMPPKASSSPRMKVIAPSMTSLSAAACSAPVETSAEAGSSGAIRASSSAGETPGSAAIWIASKPVCPSIARAVGTSQTAIVAPPRLSTSPKRARPVTVNVRTGPSAATRTVSPTANPWSSAVAWSSTTWSGPDAHAPSDRVSGLKRGCEGSMPRPKLGMLPPIGVAVAVEDLGDAARALEVDQVAAGLGDPGDGLDLGQERRGDGRRPGVGVVDHLGCRARRGRFVHRSCRRCS